MSRYLTLLFLVIGLTACAVRYPVLPKQTVTEDELQKIVAAVSKKSAEVFSLKALSKTRLSYKKDRMVLKHAISALRPKMLRVDTLPQMGAFTLGILVATDEGVIFLDPSAKEVLRSRDEALLIEKTLGIPLTANEIFAYVTARVPNDLLKAGSDSASIKGYRDDNGDYILVWENFRYYWKIGANDLLLKEFQSYDRFNGKLSLVITYDGDLKSEDIPLKRNVHIAFPRKGVTVQLLFSTLVANGEIPTSRFEVIIPDDYKVREVS